MAGDLSGPEGRPRHAIPAIRQSIRTSPRNPQIHVRYRLMGYALLLADRYDEAIVWFQKSLAANPNDSARNRGSTHAAVAAAQGLAGRSADAPASAAEASALLPAITARSYLLLRLSSPAADDMRDGLRLAGIRDHAEEDADAGVASDDLLHTDYEAPTPNTVPGARIISTAELTSLMQHRPMLLLDVSVPWGKSIPRAIGLWGAGIGGSLSDGYQERLGRKVQQLTGGDRSKPIVAMGFNSERYRDRNLALRLVALGYTDRELTFDECKAFDLVPLAAGASTSAGPRPCDCGGAGLAKPRADSSAGVPRTRTVLTTSGALFRGSASDTAA